MYFGTTLEYTSNLNKKILQIYNIVHNTQVHEWIVCIEYSFARLIRARELSVDLMRIQKIYFRRERIKMASPEKGIVSIQRRKCIQMTRKKIILNTTRNARARPQREKYTPERLGGSINLYKTGFIPDFTYKMCPV